jgi:SMI1-KNR4 cell-wall
MWRELVERLSPAHTFHPQASQVRLRAVEASLGAALPSELRDLLLESDGVSGEYDLGVVWSLERIDSDNRKFRTAPAFRELYMPFDSLMFFADAGNGDQFAFAILDGIVRRSDIFAWDHEDDSRRWVAPSLRTYLEWWLTGRIRL